MTPIDFNHGLADAEIKAADHALRHVVINLTAAKSHLTNARNLAPLINDPRKSQAVLDSLSRIDSALAALTSPINTQLQLGENEPGNPGTASAVSPEQQSPS
jgi:hypothetical protein